MTLDIRTVTSGWSPDHSVLKAAKRAMAIAVTDTGIGIPRRQAEADLRGLPAGRRHHQPQIRRHRPRPVDQPRDRAPARRRDPGDEQARRSAAPSRCTCRSTSCPRSRRSRRRAGTPARYVNTGADVGFAWSAPLEVNDDREAIKLGDRVLLIVEDDVKFAGILLDLARERGFKGVVSVTGGATLSLDQEIPPRRDHARPRPRRHRRLGRCSTC